MLLVLAAHYTSVSCFFKYIEVIISQLNVPFVKFFGFIYYELD
jgi:hypothetical protein